MSSPSSLPLDYGEVYGDSLTVDSSSGLEVLSPGSEIEDEDNNVFSVIRKLGKGEFGRVYEVSLPHHRRFALKISEDTEFSRNLFNYEAQALQYLYDNCQSGDLDVLPRFESCFCFGERLCLVTDLCGKSLLDLLEDHQFTGIPLREVQAALHDILEALAILSNLSIIHSDVKPENVLASENGRYKLIDFGSCCVVGYRVVTYCQSRYYRAPEVALRIKHDTKADVWSAGCVGAELLLGLPLFPAQSELHLISLIDEMLGPFPVQLTGQSPRTELFANGRLKTPALLCEENNETFTEFEHYFVHTRLDDIVQSFTPGSDDPSNDVENRNVLMALLHKMLALDPDDRISAEDALRDPFFSIVF